MIKQIVLSTTLLMIFEIGKAQNLFPEKFGGCTFSSFCLDCGEIKGAYNGDLTAFFAEKFQTNMIRNIEGVIFVQVLIDTAGRQCVLSIGNKATGKVSKLDLRNTINAMTGWKPAFDQGKPSDVSITLKFTFSKGGCLVTYDRFDPSAVTNMKSVGEAEITNKTSNSKLLKNEFEVYTTQNSVIPWDMTRSMSVDTNNIAWLGTDNGIVRIENNKFSVFTPGNSPLRASGNQTTITNSCIDLYNNKWFTDNEGNVYKYNDVEWTVFDSKNSPVKRITGIYSDKLGNVWLSSFDGLIKYDGKSWSVMDTANSKLPSNRIMGVFVDSKKRLWIGTDKGNIMINGSVIENFTTTDNPLKTSTLSKGYEDKEGNVWFSLYEKYPQKKGFAKYSPKGEWTVISTDNSKMPRNDVLDFAINEKTNTIWFSINRVGISEFDGQNWSTFTPENSKVPSTFIQSIAIDKDGNLWCATFAGLLKITPMAVDHGQ
jgi:ligand-binding sensor domain-containing protein